MEIGPYRVQKDGNLVENPGSWHEFANLLFVDNPVGTGYSFVDTNAYIHELDTMAEQFTLFLDKFFGLFPQYENDDVSTLWAVGDSIADLNQALYCRRVIRWTAYSLHRQSDPRSQQEE